MSNRYSFDIATTDFPVVNAPELGGESRVSHSYEDFGIVGEVSQPAPASGTWTVNPQAFVFDSVNGNDLALLCKTAVSSSVAISVTLAVTFNDGTNGTATATFALPSFVKDTSYNLPQGLAVDIIGIAPNASKTIKAVNSVNAVVGGAAFNVFQVIALPVTWYPIGCARNKSITYNTPKSKAVACGLNASAFVLAGLSEPGMLELEALHFTYADGLPRLTGSRGTIKVERYAAGRVLAERLVVGGFRPSAKTPRGDGDDEVKDTYSGNFEIFAVFV